MRLLLDENFPNLPDFISALGNYLAEIVSLHEFDPNLTSSRTPDWYLYLVAAEAEFDALVTRDRSQSTQAEELWALSKTDLSVVTWRRPIDDPIRLWGQLLAYLPDIAQVLDEHGPSIVFLPSTRLNKSSLTKAQEEIGQMAQQAGVSNQQIRDSARDNVLAALARMGQEGRFPVIQ